MSFKLIVNIYFLNCINVASRLTPTQKSIFKYIIAKQLCTMILCLLGPKYISVCSTTITIILYMLSPSRLVGDCARKYMNFDALLLNREAFMWGFHYHYPLSHSSHRPVSTVGKSVSLAIKQYRAIVDCGYFVHCT